MKCCVCKRQMRKFHYNGRVVCFATYINDNLDCGRIEFPQPFCKRCHKEFKIWLEEQNIVVQAMKKRRNK